LITNGMPANEIPGAIWRKARKSHGGYECVELAPVDGGVAMRNSRHPNGSALIFTSAEMRAFIHGAKAGEFDDVAG
jgi:hypothetical protein